MKILFTTDTIQRGGKERQLFILAKKLLLRKYEVFIIAINHAEANYIEEYSFPYKNLFYLSGKKFLEKKINFQNHLKRIKPDIIFSWDLQTSLLSLWNYKKTGAVFINGCIQHGIKLLRYSHLLRSLILWFSPYIVANSYAGLKANNIPFFKKKGTYFVLYNGIENSFYNKLNEKEKKYKWEKLFSTKYNKNRKVFISVANLVPYKDYYTVLQALKEVKKFYDFEYIILGDGPLREPIENMIDNLGLKKNVHLLGKVSNVADYLSVSDYLIHSSRGEGLSNAILEAMFMGLPVIATSVGGTPELVYKKSFALFKYKSVMQLKDILINIESLFKEFDPGSIDYRKHLEKFSVNTMTDNFLKIIENIMKHNAGKDT